jgi:hypothetical protein
MNLIRAKLLGAEMLEGAIFLHPVTLGSRSPAALFPLILGFFLQLEDVTRLLLRIVPCPFFHLQICCTHSLVLQHRPLA